MQEKFKGNPAPERPRDVQSEKLVEKLPGLLKFINENFRNKKYDDPLRADDILPLYECLFEESRDWGEGRIHRPIESLAELINKGCGIEGASMRGDALEVYLTEGERGRFIGRKGANIKAMQEALNRIGKEFPEARIPKRISAIRVDNDGKEIAAGAEQKKKIGVPVFLEIADDHDELSKEIVERIIKHFSKNQRGNFLEYPLEISEEGYQVTIKRKCLGDLEGNLSDGKEGSKKDLEVRYELKIKSTTPGDDLSINIELTKPLKAFAESGRSSLEISVSRCLIKPAGERLLQRVIPDADLRSWKIAYLKGEINNLLERIKNEEVNGKENSVLDSLLVAYSIEMRFLLSDENGELKDQADHIFTRAKKVLRENSPFQIEGPARTLLVNFSEEDLSGTSKCYSVRLEDPYQAYRSSSSSSDHVSGGKFLESIWTKELDYSAAREIKKEERPLFPDLVKDFSRELLELFGVNKQTLERHLQLAERTERDRSEYDQEQLARVEKIKKITAGANELQLSVKALLSSLEDDKVIEEGTATIKKFYEGLNWKVEERDSVNSSLRGSAEIGGVQVDFSIGQPGSSFPVGAFESPLSSAAPGSPSFFTVEGEEIGFGVLDSELRIFLKDFLRDPLDYLVRKLNLIEDSRKRKSKEIERGGLRKQIDLKAEDQKAEFAAHFTEQEKPFEKEELLVKPVRVDIIDDLGRKTIDAFVLDQDGQIIYPDNSFRSAEKSDRRRGLDVARKGSYKAWEKLKEKDVLVRASSLIKNSKGDKIEVDFSALRYPDRLTEKQTAKTMSKMAQFIEKVKKGKGNDYFKKFEIRVNPSEFFNLLEIEISEKNIRIKNKPSIAERGSGEAKGFEEVELREASEGTPVSKDALEELKKTMEDREQGGDSQGGGEEVPKESVGELSKCEKIRKKVKITEVLKPIDEVVLRKLAFLMGDEEANLAGRVLFGREEVDEATEKKVKKGLAKISEVVRKMMGLGADSEDFRLDEIKQWYDLAMES